MEPWLKTAARVVQSSEIDCTRHWEKPEARRLFPSHSKRSMSGQMESQLLQARRRTGMIIHSRRLDMRHRRSLHTTADINNSHMDRARTIKRPMVNRRTDSLLHRQGITMTLHKRAIMHSRLMAQRRVLTSPRTTRHTATLPRRQTTHSHRRPHLLPHLFQHHLSRYLERLRRNQLHHQCCQLPKDGTLLDGTMLHRQCLHLRHLASLLRRQNQRQLLHRFPTCQCQRSR